MPPDLVDYSKELIWVPGRTLKEVETLAVLSALSHFKGNRTHACRALGVSIRKMRYLTKRLREMGMRVDYEPRRYPGQNGISSSAPTSLEAMKSESASI